MNFIGDSGAASLSQALAFNSSLTNLDLSLNFIGDSGAASLSQARAVNSSLTNLDLTYQSCTLWLLDCFSPLEYEEEEEEEDSEEEEEGDKGSI